MRLKNIFDNKKILPYLLIFPAGVWLLFSVVYPIFHAIWLSFMDVRLPMPGLKHNFVFLDNYIKLLKSPDFWVSFRITLVYTFLFVFGSSLLGVITALLLNMKFKGRGIARAILIIPWAMPYVVAVLVWRWILDYQFGFLNFFLRDVLHLTSRPIEWIANPSIAIFTVVAIAIWREFPIPAVMNLAGLQTIPDELYEAAEVDGANAKDKFIHVTLPYLRTINVVVLLLLTIWGFKRVTAIYVLTKGGPAGATETLVIKSYLEAFQFFNMSYSAAIGTFMLCFSFLLSVIYLKFGLRK